MERCPSPCKVSKLTDVTLVLGVTTSLAGVAEAWPPPAPCNGASPVGVLGVRVIYQDRSFYSYPPCGATQQDGVVAGAPLGEGAVHVKLLYAGSTSREAGSEADVALVTVTNPFNSRNLLSAVVLQSRAVAYCQFTPAQTGSSTVLAVEVGRTFRATMPRGHRDIALGPPSAPCT
jgi:hypothetical protein